MKKKNSLVALLAVIVGITMANTVRAEHWIDVHFHVVGDKGEKEGFVKTAERLKEIIDSSGIDKVILMSPPRPFESFDVEELNALRQQMPSRVYLMGGGGTLNPFMQHHAASIQVSPEVSKEFEALAEKTLASGAVGFGEITAHHVSLNPGHGYESIPADHPLMLLLADIAARHDVPIDLHFDPIPEDVKTPGELSSPKNPEVLKENIAGFERLLDHNPKTRIVWAHAGADPVGFYTPDLVRDLLKKHANLYCSVRTTLARNNPMRHPRRGINGTWINLLKEFPDRFVMGTDSFLITPGYTGPNGPRVFEQTSAIQRAGVNEVLNSLDEELARKIAKENVQRIYRLKP